MALYQDILLSQDKAQTVYQNGDFVNDTGNLLIMTDDVLNFQFATLSTTLASSDDIVLTEPITTSIKFSYYDVDYSATGKMGLDKVATWNTPTFNKYAVYGEKRILELVSVKFVCPDSVFFGVKVYPRFTWVDENGQHQQSTYKLDKDPFAYYGEAKRGSTPSPAGNATCTSIAQPIIYIEGTLTYTGVSAFLATDDDKKPSRVTFVPGSFDFIQIGSDTINLMLATESCTIQPGRYDRNTLAIALTKGFVERGLRLYQSGGPDQLFIPDSKLVFRTDDPDYGDATFHLIPSEPTDNITFTNANTYVYYDPSNNKIPKVQIGARKFAIEYGIDGNVFQLSAAHQSYTDSGSLNEETVAFFQSGTVDVDLRFHQVSAATGIAIHDALPQDFWTDQLGLYNNIVVPLRTDLNGVNYYTIDDITGKLPQESSTIPVFSFNNLRLITDPPTDNPFKIDTTTTPTDAVVGETPLSNTSNLTYLIEITGLGVSQSNCHFGENILGFISAIGSGQNTTDNIITLYSENGVPYVHRGVPVAISSLRLRILGLDMEVIDTLGSDHFVQLRLERALSNQQQLPSEKKTNRKSSLNSRR